ncbi:MAG: hypothetical protein E7649_07130 [Ruminococcaceae bacterium]|nr:hypothetical protein [Oscillospiraceae bacterium]
MFTITAVAVDGATETYAASFTDADGNVTEYATLIDAFTAANENGGGKITLLTDCTVEDSINFDNYTFELDLNGKTLSSDTTAPIMVDQDATLNVTSSVGTGSILTNSADSYAIYNYGTLTLLERVTVEGAGGILNSSQSGYVATLTLDGSTSQIQSSTYAAVTNFGVTNILRGIVQSNATMGGAIETHDTLVVEDGYILGMSGILTYEGTVSVSQATVTGSGNAAVRMFGGSMTLVSGVYTGKEYNSNNELTVDISEQASLSILSGYFQNGLAVSGADINSVLMEGSNVFSTDLLPITVDDGILAIEGKHFVYPNKAALITDFHGIYVKDFDSIGAALEYAGSDNVQITVLQNNDEDIVEIPEQITFTGGKNTVSGNVINHGNISNGIFTGTVTNYWAITNGSFHGKVENMSGSFISKGHFDCEVILESGSEFRSAGSTTAGDSFKITDNGGAIACNSHIGTATCVSKGICRVCETEFADIDPNNHTEGSAATCVSLAVCKDCGEEFGPFKDHVFDSSAICTVEDCGVKAVVLVGNRLFVDAWEAINSAVEGDIIIALRDFEVSNIIIPAGVTFDATGFTVTLTEGDLIIYGILNGGSFNLIEGRVIGVEPEGMITGGVFSNNVNNSGTIVGGHFMSGSLCNNPSGFVQNNGTLYFSDEASFENLGGTVMCYAHFGGAATCSHHAICDFCGNRYGALDIENHESIVYDDEVEPDCTNTGLTAGSHCGACEREIVEQEEIPMLGHDWIDATYEAPKTCDTCGATEGEPLKNETETGNDETETGSDTDVETTKTESGEDKETSTSESQDKTDSNEKDKTTNKGSRDDDKGGCGSSIGMTAISFIAVVSLAGFGLIKKKTN